MSKYYITLKITKDQIRDLLEELRPNTVQTFKSDEMSSEARRKRHSLAGIYNQIKEQDRV
jgi:hypothetical protein